MRGRFFKSSLAGFDLETYSPKGFPADFNDPIVNASLAIEDGGGLVLFSLIYPPEEERRLLWRLLRFMDGFDGSLVTYNGSKFDLPYLARRLLRHDLPWRPALRHLDAYRLVKRALDGLPSYSQASVERALGIERCVRDVSGATYHKFFEDFLKGGTAAPALYNLEDSICCLRILSKLAAKLPPFAAR